MAWWMWLVVALLLLVGELVADSAFYLFFFGIAALLVGLMALLGLSGPSWLHWLLFSAMAVLSLLFLRRPLQQRVRRSPSRVPEDADTVIGESAVAMEEIAIGAMGRVELRGSSWNAWNRGAVALAPGQRCVVERLQGLTLEVRAQ
jgi:membrane protein implicated in regulation of membrane protease activity